MAKVKAEVWAAVREAADGTEFVPADTIALTRDEVESRATRIDARNPEYGAVNPLVRIARFELIECSDEGTGRPNGSPSGGNH